MEHEVSATEYVDAIKTHYPHWTRLAKVTQGYLKDEYPAWIWLRENIGPGHGPKMGNTDNLIINLDNKWMRQGFLVFFKEEKDAALFKIFWGC